MLLLTENLESLRIQKCHSFLKKLEKFCSKCNKKWMLKSTKFLLAADKFMSEIHMLQVIYKKQWRI